jgi:hypothetical protein
MALRRDKKAVAAAGLKLPIVEPGKNATVRERVVRADSGDVEIGVIFGQRRRALQQKFPRNVHGRILREVRQGVQEGPYLDTRATSEFHQMGATADQFGDFAQPVFQNADFRTCWIIFIQFANLVE